VLGLRLMKTTVNFDAPDVYHLYDGDEVGTPGTILTFFPAAARGHHGAGTVDAIASVVPAGSLTYWMARLADHGIVTAAAATRFGQQVLAFIDPDGLALELVADDGDVRPRWAGGRVPVAHAIRGFHGATLLVRDTTPTARILIATMGLRVVGEEGGRVRYATGDGAPGTHVDVVAAPTASPAVVAAGMTHHIAWRVADDEAELRWWTALTKVGLDVTDVHDRDYFRSIYFRAPGGALFEIATDPPGSTVDEDVDNLGASLKLPRWLEPRRAHLERLLPPLPPGTGVRPRCRSRPHLHNSAARITGMDTTNANDLGLMHRYVPAAAGPGPDGCAAPTLLLLHGTGGDEHDLLPLGRALVPDAALLSARGKVLEHGLPRFFRRLAEGVFDEEDVIRRADELALFVARAADVYGFDPARIVAAGYSNGANIAAAVLLLHPRTLAGAALFHAMVPLEPVALPDLTGRPVFLAAGSADPIVPAAGTERLVALLRAAGADVTLHWERNGHSLIPAEVRAAQEWLRGALPPGDVQGR